MTLDGDDNIGDGRRLPCILRRRKGRALWEWLAYDVLGGRWRVLDDVLGDFGVARSRTRRGYDVLALSGVLGVGFLAPLYRGPYL